MPLGPFHRVENGTTQTAQVALRQQESGEIWGRPHRGSNIPCVKAYPGELRNRRGVEFTTNAKPTHGSAPNEARWHLGFCIGVESRQKGGIDFACIRVTTFSNGQQ